MQLDVDIGSSSVAKGVVNLVLGYLSKLVIELAFLIQVLLLNLIYLYRRCRSSYVPLGRHVLFGYFSLCTHFSSDMKHTISARQLVNPNCVHIFLCRSEDSRAH